MEEHGHAILPCLPDEIAVECLIRVSMTYNTLQSMRGVSRTWRHLLTDSENILKERRKRNLQLPSLFLIPCIDNITFLPFKYFSCVPRNSSILMLGGHREGSSVSDFWTLDTLTRTIRKSPDMINCRQDFIAAVLRDRLFALGGLCQTPSSGSHEIENVEVYDFGTQIWTPAPPLPLSTYPLRCSVDSVSDEMLVWGSHSEEDGDTPEVLFSRNAESGSWTELDNEDLEPHQSRKWRWCSGELLLENESLQGVNTIACDDESAWHFPSHVQVSEGFVRAVMQPTMTDDGNDDYRDPLTIMNPGKFVLSANGDGEMWTASIKATVHPSNAEFFPSQLNTITNSEPSTMVCEVVATPAMRHHMQFPRDGSYLYCRFAILFF